MLKITCVCFSLKTGSCLLKNTKRTQKYSLDQFSTKFTRAELVKTRALFAGIVWFRGPVDPFSSVMSTRKQDSAVPGSTEG